MENNLLRATIALNRHCACHGETRSGKHFTAAHKDGSDGKRRRWSRRWLELHQERFWHFNRWSV